MRLYLFFYPLALLFGFIACNSSETATQNDPVQTRIDSLVAIMTLDEKIGQMNLYNGTWEFTGPVPENKDQQKQMENIRSGRVGGMLNVLSAANTRAAQKEAVENSRLGIPLIFGYDVIHGYQTMMPVPLAQASSWDPEVARKSAEIAAIEASAAGVNWTYAPMVDISRDARWGRIMEGAGEDPYLTSVMAAAWVKGFQGDDLALPQTIAACVKHFAGYGYAEGGRDYNTTEITDQTLYNVVLPPFKAAVDAGVATVMNSFNDLNGIPATGNALLQRKILKGDWNFKGFVVSDWGSVGEMMAHGYTADTLETAVAAANAGSDMDMEGKVYETSLKEAVEKGLVKQELIDDAVRRILKVKFDLGLFEDPYRYCNEERESKDIASAEAKMVARDMARRSMVLLKNDKGILPLKKETSSIAVIGSLAASKDQPLGNWRGKAIENSGISVLEGIKSVVGERAIYAEGYKIAGERRNFLFELEFIEGDRSGFADAIKAASKADVVVMVLGEDCFQTGEGRSQTDITLKGEQLALIKEIHKVNSAIVTVLMNGRPLVIPEVFELSGAVLEAWYGGSEAGNAVADLLFGDFSPSGRLPVSFPYAVGQMPLYYAKKSTGRPNESPMDMVFWSHYVDAPNDPVLPFGYGLDYTSFEISEPVLSSETMGKGGQIEVKATVTNTGNRKGSEVVQLYIQDLHASAIRPVMELKDFKRVILGPGESSEVTFTIDEKMLSFYRADLTFGIEPGKFKAMVGKNAAEFGEKGFIYQP